MNLTSTATLPRRQTESTPQTPQQGEEAPPTTTGPAAQENDAPPSTTSASSTTLARTASSASRNDAGLTGTCLNNATDPQCSSSADATTSSSSTLHTPSANSTSEEPSIQGHTTGSLAGAAVGSFVGGALFAVMIMAVLLAWRKRRDRRKQRDQRIKDSIMNGIDNDDGPSEDMVMSSTIKRKPLSTPGSERKLPAADPGHIAMQLVGSEQQSRDGATAAASGVTNSAASQSMIRQKRQSMPEALQIGAPKRMISISASGLISPVAATHPAQDQVKHLRVQVSTLFEQIEMHVDNFYHNEKTGGQGSGRRGWKLTPAYQEKLQRFDSPYLDDSIAGLLMTADDVRVLIKHCIAQSMVWRLDYTSRIDAHEALIPPSLLATYRLMATSPKNAAGLDLKQWRTQTVSLLNIENVEQSMISRVRNLAAEITDVFHLWAVGRYGSEARSSHLGKILTEAAELGLEIFGMRGEAKWSWPADPISNDRISNVAVFPGLIIELGRGSNAVANGVVQGTESGSVEVVKPVRTRVRFET